MSATEMATPGCFGSILSYQDGANSCSTCNHETNCRTLREKTLAELRADLGLNPSVIDKARLDVLKKGSALQESANEGRYRRQRKMSELTPEQEQLLADESIPKKARTQLRRIFESGLSEHTIRQSLAGRINPFINRSPRFMEIATTSMIESRAFSSGSLKVHMMRSTAMSEGSARSHINIALGIYSALGVIEKTADGFRLKEDIDG